MPFTTVRKVIDISGDGPDEVLEQASPYGANVAAKSYRVPFEREHAIMEGITINVLPINDPDDDYDIVFYYREHVMSPDGIWEEAVDFEDFPRAIKRKLIMDIAGPVPILLPPKYIFGAFSLYLTYLFCGA
jgi:hypothetical protein